MALSECPDCGRPTLDRLRCDVCAARAVYRYKLELVRDALRDFLPREGQLEGTFYGLPLSEFTQAELIGIINFLGHTLGQRQLVRENVRAALE